MNILSKIGEAILAFFRALTPATPQEQEEKYLSEATSLEELEYRQRQWSRQRESFFVNRPNL